MRREKTGSHTNRDRCGGTLVLITVLVDHLLEIFLIVPAFIHQDVIVSGSGSPLDCRVRAQIEVVLEWMSNVALDQDTWHGVAVPVGCYTRSGEETYVMALLGNYNGEQDLNL